MASAEGTSDRKMGLLAAGASNMLDMIGVGPFLSIPLALLAMHGSSVLLPWVLGAVISLCDGLVWAELGSAMPFSGGPYFYLRSAFGSNFYGNAASFLVLWTTVLTAPLLIASGAVGFAQYFHDLWPILSHVQLSLLAMTVCLVNVVLLYRRITTVGTISVGLWVLVIGTIVWIIVAGAAHIPSSFTSQVSHMHPLLHKASWGSLGSATLIAVYDYAGYYNVCLIGGEVKRPARNIPYAIIGSILLVALLYIAMNLAIVGVLPVQQSMDSNAIVADFVQRIYGAKIAKLADVLILVASFASVFAVLLGSSRIPFAAARRGEFFHVFAKEHPTKGFPTTSLVILGFLSACACVLSLNTLISLVIAIQITVQFLAQCVAVMMLRRRYRRERKQTFRMPLYPLPAIVAILGWLFVLLSSGWRIVLLAVLSALVGIAAFAYTTRQKQYPRQLVA